MMKNLLPRRHDAAPDFSTLRKVLLRQKDAAFVPMYELFANREIIEQLTESEDTGTDNWKFYLWAGTGV